MNQSAMDGADRLLKVTEIFYSLQGESRSVGWPTTFIRLTGCPLRCTYCDTEYAFEGGEQLSIRAVMDRASGFPARHITVTGGEPLVQKGVYPLMRKLCDEGYQVSLETGGMVDISAVDTRVSRVVDLKTPGSGEVDKNHWGNLQQLTANDQLKVVLADREDYEWFLPILVEHQLEQKCEVLLSPVQGRLDPTTLADWILEDRLQVRFQLQLHKILWGDQPGR